MSKESLKSSINSPEEGVKNAEESNKLKPSINTPEGVNIQNPEPVQDQEQPVPSNSQEEKKTRKILKDDPKLKGTRMARAGAAATALAGATAEAGYHVTAGIVKGVAKGGSKVATAVSKAADPLDKVRKGGKIKEEGQHSPGLYDKALNKIRTSVPGGNTIADGLDKTYKVISSKGVKRMLKVGGAISSVALNPTPIGVGIAALSLTAVAYNVTKETLEVREDKKLDREKAALESIKGAKAQQLNKVLEAKENIAKDAPNLQKFLDTKIPDIYKNPPEPSPDKTFEGGWAKQFVKSVRDTTLEAASLFADGIATGSIGGIAFAATAAFVNITGEVDSNIVHMERGNDKKNKINALKLSAGNYENEKELKELEKQEKINNQTLKEFLDTPNIDKLNQIQLEAAFATKQKEVAERKEFKEPPEKSGFEKVKSAVKAGASYFVEAQFGEVKEAFSKENKQTQTPVTLNAANKVQKPEISKAQEQVHNMQENLTHGKISGYNNSITPPQSTQNASKHHESSVGR